MRGATSLLAGTVSWLVGLALMVVETVRVLNGSTLTGVNNVLLFVGLGLVALGGALLVYSVLVDTEPVGDADLVDDTHDINNTHDVDDDTAGDETVEDDSDEVAEPADETA
jgi:hypothetical protein